MFKPKDFISYSPSQGMIGKQGLGNGSAMQGQSFGVLDRLRVSQQLLEQRE